MNELSVVTITYNDVDGLIRTKNSLPSSGINWIIIDGSTSNEAKSKNLELLQGLDCVHIQEPDRGRFHAMNKGLALVKSPLVNFLNSGDAFAHQKVAVEILESFHTSDWNWIVGQTTCVDKEGIVKWQWPMPQYNSIKFKLSIRAYSHQATIYKTDFINLMGGFYEDSIYSDWLLSLKMAKHSSPAIYEKVWCHFLEGGVSSLQTVDFWRKECVRLRTLENLQIGKSKILDYLLQNAAALLIRIDRGKLLLRPDLSKKYGTE